MITRFFARSVCPVVQIQPPVSPLHSIVNDSITHVPIISPLSQQSLYRTSFFMISQPRENPFKICRFHLDSALVRALVIKFREIKLQCKSRSLKHAAAAAATLGSAAHSLALLLHNLANLHRRIEELGCASVEADGFALVELALAVVGRDALFLARLLQAVFWCRHHVSNRAMIY